MNSTVHVQVGQLTKKFSANFQLSVSCSISLCLNVPDMLDWSFGEEAGPDEGKLLDHQPLRLNNDDYERVQQIPVKKVGC